MRMRHAPRRRRAAIRAPTCDALVAALLLFGAIVTFVSSCGGDDLVFPGNVAADAAPGEHRRRPKPTEDV